MERTVARNGVVYYRSTLIPCIHGFSTRIGGVSRLPHTASLNLGVERGDSRETVIENLSLFADALDVDRESIISVSQIHSTKIRYITEKERGEGFFCHETEACDGYITDRQGVTLGVRTADCVPILLYAPPTENFSGAVSALHAGWRGTAAGIAREAVEMLSEMGADVSLIKAAIGPAIGSCCYTVREDFFAEFKEKAGVALTEKYVTAVSHGVWKADLKGANWEILSRCGLSDKNIDVCRLCTCCEPDEFFSHRYSGGVRGTMLSVIALDKNKTGDVYE